MQGNSELKAQWTTHVLEFTNVAPCDYYSSCIIQVVIAIQLSTIYELLHIWAVNHGYQDGIPAESVRTTDWIPDYLQPQIIS